MKICDTTKCTGCFACINKCPVKCIKMEKDELGHIYPNIDEAKCVNCGLCKNTCPVNNSVSFNKPVSTYAAYSLDEEIHKSSSSGGIAATFSKYVVNNGGVVYGCSSLVKDEICHIRVENEEDLSLLRGSKYVQSHINNCFINVKEDLLKNKQVLFTGTPCQVSGLKNFLGKDYSNLVTMDIICHGVPSQQLLMEHINKFAKKPFELSFRNEEGYTLSVFDALNKKLIYKKPHTADLYFTGFSKCLFYRESCHKCEYSKSERCSDITVGDFWKLGKEIPYYGERKNGVSVVLVNTDRGIEFLQKVKDLLYLEERTLDEAIAGNGNLARPTVPHKKRAVFAELYKKYSFRKAMIKTIRIDIVKYRILRIINKSNMLIRIVTFLQERVK